MVIDPAHRPAGPTVRQQTEIATAAAGKLLIEQLHSGDRDFQQFPPVIGIKGKTGRARHAVEVMADGIDTRTIAMPGFLEDLQCPQVLGADGIASGAITADLMPREVFQQSFGAHHIIAKLLGVLLRHPHVRITVTGQLMSRRDDTPHQIGITFRHPAQHEKGGLHIMIGEQGQHPVGVTFHPARQCIPVLAPDMLFECGNVEVILHIHRHGISYHILHRQSDRFSPLRRKSPSGSS